MSGVEYLGYWLKLLISIVLLKPASYLSFVCKEERAYVFPVSKSSTSLNLFVHFYTYHQEGSKSGRVSNPILNIKSQFV